MGSKVKKIASIALPIAASFIPGVGPVLGATLGGAAGGALQGGGLKGALLGAATGFAGNAIGSSLAPSLANAGLSGTVGGTLGKTASNVLGPTIANTALSKVAGNVAGNAIADQVADTFTEEEDISEPSKAVSPFVPKRQAQLDLPGSLGGYSGLEESQQSTNIANQGVYGGGLGPDEQSYFQNLINRRLVDESGNVDEDLSEVSPIEQSYLAQLGLGGYSNTRSLLEAMSKWKAQ